MGSALFVYEWGFGSLTKQETCNDRQDGTNENKEHRNGSGRSECEDEKVNQHRADLNGHLCNRDDIAGLGIFKGDLVLPGNHAGGESQNYCGDDKKVSLEVCGSSGHY